MKISVLEQGVCYENQSIQQTLHDLTIFAKKIDEIGYHRLWFAEHHNSKTFLSNNPDLLMGHLLNQTKNIRLGSGGIMAMNYGSLQIAERFLLLATLFENRVDLGIGRSFGTDLLTANLLNQHQCMDIQKLNQHIEEIITLIHGDFPIIPAKPINLPEIFLLGSSGSGLNLALKNKINYSFAHFFSSNQDKNLFSFFKDQSKHYNGKCISCITVYAADTYEEALEESLPFYYYKLHKKNEPLKTTFTLQEKQEIYNFIKNEKTTFIGTYDDVTTQLNLFAKDHFCDELMIVHYQKDINKKIKFFQEIAKRLIQKEHN